jgi:sec-independent protein translocase protein TatA
MFGLGLPELIVIFVIALLIFGPKKLPDLGRSVGRAMAEFKKASEDFKESMHEEMKEVEKNVQLDELKKIGQEITQPGPQQAAEPEKDADAKEKDKETKENVDGNA